MTAYRKLYIGASAGVGLTLVLLACIFFLKQEQKWPEFPATAVGPAPLVQLQVERDFGWRTGDAVTLNIFIKTFAGTSVDVEGIALAGDFEIRGDIRLDSRKTEDGGKITRVQMSVQSFNFKPAVSARVSMTWNKDGEKDWKEIDPTSIELHTSATYDGRDNLQEGKLQYLQGFHLWVTLAWIVGGIGVVIMATLYIRRETRNLPVYVPPVEPMSMWVWAVIRFESAWTKILAGDRSPEVFQEIDYVVRTLLMIETVALTHVEIALSNHPFGKQGTYIIKACELVLFRGDKLKDSQLKQMKLCFEQIVANKVFRNAAGELYSR